MKLYLLLPLISLVISQQCTAGTNCPLNQGFCSGGTCQCLEGYRTFYDKSLPMEQQVYCNYKQINHFIPLVLEFCFLGGFGHFYVGKYILGFVKLFLEVSAFGASFYLYKEFRVPDYVEALKQTFLNRIIPDDVSRSTGGLTTEQIMQFLFNFTFHPFWILYLFDLYMYFTKAYKDGNNIPLI